jgi:mono/diheme cytochrome c family protein
MHKERNKMLFKMLCNRLLYAILLSGFFTFGTYAAFAQEGAEAEAAEEAPAQGADGIPTSEAALAEGKKLYTNACAVCHGIHEQVVGPALVNVTDRRPVEWLIDFIHNSQKVIQSGDEYAVNIYNQFNKMQMPNFDYLSNDEVLSILAYIQQESQVTASAAAEGGDGVATTGTTAGESQGGVSSEYLTLIIAGFIFILVLILIVLILLTVVLTKFLKNKDDLDEEDKAVLEQKTDIGKVFKHKAFIGLLAFLFVAVALRAVLDGLFTIGVQQGYAPTQPIAFSHALHAGEFEIDCNYCHTGVRKSKNANIPSANICMNCHSMITKVTGEEEDSKEIRKIHAAIENNQPMGEGAQPA